MARGSPARFAVLAQEFHAAHRKAGFGRQDVAITQAIDNDVAFVIAARRQRAAIDGDFLDFFNWFLRAFAGIALLVATFSIHNTFSILVAQRGRRRRLFQSSVAADRRRIRTIFPSPGQAGTHGAPLPPSGGEMVVVPAEETALCHRSGDIRLSLQILHLIPIARNETALAAPGRPAVMARNARRR